MRSLLDYFRGPAPIRDAAGLADFIDSNAAFLVQKGIYEYSRARAGHYAKILMSERTFIDLADRARWLAFPLGLAMMGELAEGVLYLHSGEDKRDMQRDIRALVLSIFDRYPLPAVVGADDWSAARAELARRLDLASLHPPKRSIDIPETFVDPYFALMPIHEKLKATDYPTTRNYLRISLCNIHDELTKRIDPPAVVAALRQNGE